MRNAVICISRGVNLASALGSTGMRGAVIEKTLKNEANVGLTRREVACLPVGRDCHGLCLISTELCVNLSTETEARTKLVLVHKSTLLVTVMNYILFTYNT